MTLLLQTANAFPLFLLISGVLSSAVSGKKIGILFTIGLLLSQSINIILKLSMKSLIGKTNITRRPCPPKTGCGWFPKKSIHMYMGFPSGHAQSISFALSFWLLYLYDTKSERYVKSISTVVLTAIWFGVVYSRVYQGCHSVLQVSVGSLIGICLGYGYYQIAKKYIN